VDNNPPAQALWHARSEAFAYLELERPRQLVVFQKLFALIDRCIDSYEVRETTNLYATVCAVTLLKAKNLGVAAYSLVLDGLGPRPQNQTANRLNYESTQICACGVRIRKV
jgi:hypothetical protein